MISTKTLTIYQTSDGREFPGDELGAKRHEFVLSQKPAIERFVKATVNDERHAIRVTNQLLSFAEFMAKDKYPDSIIGEPAETEETRA